MLRREVVEAAEQGKFHIYAVSTIDEGIEVLTGLAAGKRDEKGHYPTSTINGLVEKQLQEYAERLKHSSAATPSKAADEERES
jgi:predicted ATP-dependent protease